MENKSICSECKGQCCKKSSGIYLLDEVRNYKDRLGKDLSVRVEILLNPYVMVEMPIPDKDRRKFNLLLQNGLADIEDFASFFLIVKPIGEKDKWGTNFIGGSKNKCEMLTSTGCKLSHDNRPYECRELVPNKTSEGFVCGSDNVNVKVERSWLSEQAYLRDYITENIVAGLKGIGCKRIEDIPKLVESNVADILLSMFENNFNNITVKFEGEMRKWHKQ